MVRHVVAAMLMVGCVMASARAQTKKPAGTTSVTYDVTIAADGAYTGTMDLAVKGGKVSGNMHITKPTEITGKVAGTSKAGVMALEFPYQMVQRNCTGQIAIAIKAPPKTASTTGTVSIVGCGRGPENKLAGTIDLKPVPKKR
jgi:hypothetical protein